jgi:hypothetical protein
LIADARQVFHCLIIGSSEASMSDSAQYWVSRANKEQQLARKSASRGEATFHRDLSRRFLEMAVEAARQNLPAGEAGK